MGESLGGGSFIKKDLSQISCAKWCQGWKKIRITNKDAAPLYIMNVEATKLNIINKDATSTKTFFKLDKS